MGDKAPQEYQEELEAYDRISRLLEVAELARQVFTRPSGVLLPVTPERVKKIREELGLSQAGLGQLLRLGAHGKRTVARWEAGDVPVSGPVSVALEALESGWSPGDGRWHDLRQAYLSVLDAIDDAVRQAREQVHATGAGRDDDKDSRP
jgi:DNA-binding transcriptional regulator YiaG